MLNGLKAGLKQGMDGAATHFAGRHRLTENSCGSNVIVIDIDGDTTLARFWQTDTARHVVYSYLYIV